MPGLVCWIPRRSSPLVDLPSLSDMNEGTIGSMKALGITESYKLKRQVVLSATEAAEMIIRFVIIPLYILSDLFDCRVDDILRATPRKREAV